MKATRPVQLSKGAGGTVMTQVDLSQGVSDHIAGLVTDLLNRFSRVVLVSVLGDKGGEYNPAFSLEQFVPHLEQALSREVRFIGTNVGPDAEATLDRIPAGSVVLLENLRFCKSERRNPRSFAIRLSCLADFLHIDADHVPQQPWAHELANLLPAALPLTPNHERKTAWPG
jgi:phosphoglycerate kinase